MRMAFLVATAILLGAGSSPLSAQSTPAATTPVLRPGDAVRVTVWRKPEMSGEFLIAENGTIAHPLYREIQVANLPVSTAEERLDQFLRRLETDPQFTLEPLLRVSVGGEVRQPNLYRLPPATSIAEAVAQAGGAMERGNLSQVRLFRDEAVLTVDLTDPASTLAQSPIRSGDQIFVARRAAILRDYVGPAASITAAAAAFVNLLLRL